MFVQNKYFFLIVGPKYIWGKNALSCFIKRSLWRNKMKNVMPYKKAENSKLITQQKPAQMCHLICMPKKYDNQLTMFIIKKHWHSWNFATSWLKSNKSIKQKSSLGILNYSYLSRMLVSPCPEEHPTLKAIINVFENIALSWLLFA